LSRGLENGAIWVRTDDHGSKLEALSYTLPVDLVRKIGEPDVTHELFADDGGDTVSVRAATVRQPVLRRRHVACVGRQVRVRHLRVRKMWSETGRRSGFVKFLLTLVSIGTGRESKSGGNILVVLSCLDPVAGPFWSLWDLERD
jgi:hypothetical protein